jgi:ribosome-binding protein aMBF1 (putative translation factor)
MRDFGDLIQRQRLAKGWSRETLAERAGLELSMVNDAETATDRLDFSVAQSLADALGLAIVRCAPEPPKDLDPDPEDIARLAKIAYGKA